MTPTRRDALRLLAAVTLAGAAPHPMLAQARGRIVVIGGGFGGGTCARYLRRLAPELEVTLIEQNPHFVTCPFSNLVLGGLADMDLITHGFDGLRRDGVEVVQARAEAIDAERGAVRLEGGDEVQYDRLVVAPGIDFHWDVIEGYDEATAEIMPHAWKAGPQTTLLRSQLEAMQDGGVFVMSIPQNPYRCPPGPYERASLVAHYFQNHKPRSKIILVDSKDSFSKQGLFEEGWAELYGDLIEWVPFGMTGATVRVDPAAMTVHTEFDAYPADVANVIPPQRSGRIVDTAGLTDGGDWCIVDPHTFESAVVRGIHVLGDSIVAGGMPKSGFSAGTQAMFCASVIAAMQADAPLPRGSFVNTCYSLLAPEYGISVVDVFRITEEGEIAGVQGAGGVSPSGAGADFRYLEAEYARGWYASTTTDIYG